MIKFFEDYGYIIELTLALSLFLLTFKRRRFFVLRLLAPIALMIFIYFLWNEVIPKNVYIRSLMFTVMLVVSVAGIVFCFETKLASALFSAVGAIATQHMAFKVGNVLQVVFYDILSPFSSAAVYLMSDIVVFAICYFVFARRIKRKETQNIDNIQIMLLSIVLVLFTVVIQNSIVEFQQSIDIAIFVILTLFDIICCIFTLSIQYDIFKSGKMQEEYNMMEHVLHQQKAQMELSKANIDLINVKCHDLKHQILRHGEKLSKEDVAELEKMVFIYNSVLQTGNESLDVILTEKSLLFEKNKVKLDCIIDGESLRFMSASDIYSLFGNALDNSFEAVRLIENTGKRLISIYIKEIMGLVSIHIQNNYLGNLVFDNDLPVTTKADTQFHGFGIKSIKLIVEKYKGTMTLNVENGIFNLNILIPQS